MSVLLVIMKQALLCLEVMSRTENWLKQSGWDKGLGRGEGEGREGCHGVPCKKLRGTGKCVCLRS